MHFCNLATLAERAYVWPGKTCRVTGAPSELWSPHPGAVLPTTIATPILVLTDNWPTDDSTFPVPGTLTAHVAPAQTVRSGREVSPGAQLSLLTGPWARRHTWQSWALARGPRRTRIPACRRPV